MSHRHVSRVRLVALCFGALVCGTAMADQAGQRLPSSTGVRESTNSIQQRQANSTPVAHVEHELQYPDRSTLQQNAKAPAVAQYPSGPGTNAPAATRNIHTLGASFDGATLTDTGAFPPDSMGTVGPA